MDLNLSISDEFVKTKIYDKRDDFGFGVVGFPFLDGDVPRLASCGVCVSQLVRFARVSSHVDDLNTRDKVLAAKLLSQGCGYHKIREAFSRFCRQRFGVVSVWSRIENTSSAGPFGAWVLWRFGFGGMIGEGGVPCRFRE